MASYSSFSMMVKGELDNIEKFFGALTQADNKCWIGRGADADIDYEEDDDGNDIAYIDGNCKGSIEDSLFDDAVSMEKQRTTGEGSWGGIEGVEKFLTLFEACEAFHVNVEVFASGIPEEMTDHYKYENGVTVIDHKDEDFDLENVS